MPRKTKKVGSQAPRKIAMRPPSALPDNDDPQNQETIMSAEESKPTVSEAELLVAFSAGGETAHSSVEMVEAPAGLSASPVQGTESNKPSVSPAMTGSGGIRSSTRTKRAPAHFRDEVAAPTTSTKAGPRTKRVKFDIHSDNADEGTGNAKQMLGEMEKSESDKSKAKSPSESKRAQKGKAKPKDIDYLLTNPKSTIAYTNLTRILSHPLALDCLSKEEREHLAIYLPGHIVTESEDNGTLRIPEQFLKYDPDWRTAIRVFQEDLSAGRYDPLWLEQAGAAMEERAHGDFDAWKAREYEAFWGQKQKMQSHVLAGFSAKIRCADLISADVLHPGDVWAFSRTFKQGKGPLLVMEKEVQVDAIVQSDQSLRFRLPPGQHKFSAPAVREDVMIDGIHGPQAIMDAIIKEDGRLDPKKVPSSNGWKCFRVKRSQQDLGTLWDMREAYWLTKTKTILLSFETIGKPHGVDVLIKGRGKGIKALQTEIAAAVKGSATVYHLDVPTSQSSSPYSPQPLSLLKYLATTVLTCHSISHVLTRKRAKDRSLAEPLFGVAEQKEGVLVGLGANDREGVVIEMEHRRKSGRGVTEWFFLATAAPRSGTKDTERINLLQDHPLYRASEQVSDPHEDLDECHDLGGTFNLELTAKQRQDREGVVLPHFDAQKGDGMVGEGGRILYDMGAEDDFDEEEDEI
ncbi:MAG: hypothetical protein M1817_004561 [Caeruleum heppii]|nr:MAG: hypothetical protein M1817_004561 [Caeruleum heppii]